MITLSTIEAIIAIVIIGGAAVSVGACLGLLGAGLCASARRGDGG